MKMNNEKEIDGRPLRIDFPDGGKQGKKDSVCIAFWISSRLREAIVPISLRLMLTSCFVKPRT